VALIYSVGRLDVVVSNNAGTEGERRKATPGARVGR
jgi:hypothetical protein